MEVVSYEKCVNQHVDQKEFIFTGENFLSIPGDHVWMGNHRTRAKLELSNGSCIVDKDNYVDFMLFLSVIK